ncbi:CBS domain-containing protein [Candidatus Pacearchaeota archaeon]|nr:CBS domain-containing protein [Candidatus Pacearchaeota archaeon]
MKRGIIIIYIICILIFLNTVYAVDEPLPTLVYGKVILKSGSGIPGAKILATWQDNDKVIKISDTQTFDLSAAERFEDEGIIGRYRIVIENIDERNGSIVILETLGHKVNVTVYPALIVKADDIILDINRSQLLQLNLTEENIEYLSSIFTINASELDMDINTSSEQEMLENDSTLTSSDSGKIKPIEERKGTGFQQKNKESNPISDGNSGQVTSKKSEIGMSVILGLSILFLLIIVIGSLTLIILYLKEKIKRELKKRKKEKKVSIYSLDKTKVSKFMKEDYVFIGPEGSISDAIDLFVIHNIGMLPVVSNGILKGVLNKKDLVFKINNNKGLDKMPVKKLMREKYISVDPSKKMGDLYTIMLEKNIRELVVLKKGKIIGTVNYFDILNMFSHTNLFIENPPKMGKAMSRTVDTINQNTTLENLRSIFRMKNIEYCVIVKNKKPVGIVTLKDVVSAMKKTMNFKKTIVKNIMSSSLISMNQGTSIYKGFKIVNERKFNQIPIIDMYKQLIGVVNIEYLVRAYYEFITSFDIKGKLKLSKEMKQAE